MYCLKWADLWRQSRSPAEMTEQTFGRKTSGPLQALTTSPLIIFIMRVKKWVETMHIPGSCGVEGTFFLLCGTAAGLDQFTLHNLKHTHGHTHALALWWFGVWAWWQNKCCCVRGPRFLLGLQSPWPYCRKCHFILYNMPTKHLLFLILTLIYGFNGARGRNYMTW